LVPYTGANDRICAGPACGNIKNRLNEDEKIVSKNGRYTWIMQSDGNAVLYDAKQGSGGYNPNASKWASKTSGDQKDVFYTEVDSKEGSLRVYKNGKSVYNTKAAPFSPSEVPVVFIMQDDGNFVGYQCDQAFWSTNTWVFCIWPFC